ncbi:DEAD/DEAH box helicase family protein [Streptococcus mutans]|uniref:DEAD/DEAH box helicase n=1 Tax=Streptococcus mutans TaxID=1309 RepID=UPI0001B0575F|nr:type ISP restriction/modification enzyme [Streptococcus mutans]MCB4945929.1 DEAD/DEAH box helicase family protein [Streptococcus mutans]MCB4958958.1 DEAD/DEAH box helicase family protein [Streptococcus mutans]MCB5026290.1 DEAD/DEAH box helicase family protein [Streptococcus mutans]MCB5032861.1 DEAD/DEAH box helicase family protein [Streptococcus mutans]MCB5045013.1 DEAD/DEAH box helicase family protein [Streptococcus mutans]
MSFDNLVAQINEVAEAQRDRGTYFEYLVKAYLANEPTYKNEFKNVWMLAEVPEEFGIPNADIGVDLVAEKATGELVAIQAKFYNHAIQKSNIDSFLSELGKDYYESGIIVASTDNWGKNAEKALADRSDVIRIGLSDLRHSQIDWEQFSFDRPESVVIKEKKQPRYYQKDVIKNALEHFKEHDRGQLIMAPGTGKTFTSLKVTEALAKKSGQDQFVVLYLVPSIQLLTQTLRGWNNDTEMTMSSMAVTSDRNATRDSVKQDESNFVVKASDIGYPATTSAQKVVKNYEELMKQPKKELLVVFSTYQSIDVLGKAQINGFPEFDLIIGDEAHRTTGAKALGEDASVFTKVHSNLNIKGKKRLYQTATPKLYGAEAKKKADDLSVVISSMDDESLYGKVFYRLGFGDAISQDILTDYKLMVLAVDESVVQRDMQKSLSDPENGLNIDDVGRIIGVWNGMIKRESFTDNVSGEPMKRAIAFSRTINDSKRLSDQFEKVVNEYLDSDEGYSVDVRHVDGGMNALQKSEALDWLASDDIPDNSARILSNVRFLTEGIDVPNLDAIVFLSPRKSQVDIVQAVGRIIRKHEDKDYGYIILPIVIPAGETPETILDNNKSYDVVWQVLNALRSVDERFEATINKLELNKSKPKNIQIIGVGGAPDDPNITDGYVNEPTAPYQTELELEWEAVEGAIYGKIVQKVGDRRYLEDWSKDVADIARRHTERIKIILEQNPDSRKAFDKFLSSLQHNINESIDEKQAIEMLSQHLITLPIFDALFEDYSFIKHNPVSQAMEKIIEEFSQYGFEKEQRELQPFYESVRLRASGIDNAQAKQKIIVTLYDKFFQTGFKSTTERLGIVFTPVEVVDFIVRSVDVVLRKHFGKTLASENVHILDPFTGTGTFITRTLHYLKELMDKGEITYADILRNYTQELHANEIVLLSYYIAAINIEAVFDEINGDEGYQPFKGIVLTDTFESTESEDTLDDSFFETNDKRLKRQQEKTITVIMGNPPYSAKQNNEDDNTNRNEYLKLDSNIRRKWIETSSATNKNGLLDSYIRALRWSIDRLEKDGVVAFITNSSFIDGVAMDGLRASLEEEIDYIYLVDLKGQIRRRSKAQAKVEGGNIFDIMTGVAITILVKKGDSNLTKGKIKYFNIGDFLTKKEKLTRLSNLTSIQSIHNFTEITPNQKKDWLNQRNSDFDNLIKLGNKKGEDALFYEYTGGIKTGRDAWTTNFSKNTVIGSMDQSIKYYQENLGNIEVYNINSSKISWTRSLKQRFEKSQNLQFNPERIFIGMYRPFTKKYFYYDPNWTDQQYKMSKVLPYSDSSNVMLSLSNKTEGKQLSSLAINVLPDVNLFAGGSQNLPKYLYDNMGSYSSIREEVLRKFDDLSESSVLPYIYGVFHSIEYKKTYFSDLSKEFPRLPNLKNKDDFIKVGQILMDLHINYENIPAYDGIELRLSCIGTPSYKVSKMKFAKKRDENGKSVNDLSTIIFNDDITISNIPERAYYYVVNGRSAIEWIIDQYQVKTDTKSGITDDPNLYSDDEKYIFNLLLSIINVSMQTIDLVNSLPKFEVEE